MPVSVSVIAQTAERRSFTEREPCLIHSVKFGSTVCIICGQDPKNPGQYPKISIPTDMVTVSCHYCQRTVQRSKKHLQELVSEGKHPACDACALELKLFKKVL